MWGAGLDRVPVPPGVTDSRRPSGPTAPATGSRWLNNGNARHVFIVESHHQAATVGTYLGANYEVFAVEGSVGLPFSVGTVRPDDDFGVAYEIDGQAEAALRAIAAALGDASRLILATGLDRDGEAKAWRVLTWLRAQDALGERQFRRVVFREVTRDAVQRAVARPRGINISLVHAEHAAGALDYLFRYHLSSVLRRVVPGIRSPGRGTSVALRLICDRETEIETFTERESWTVDAEVLVGGGRSFRARLNHLTGQSPSGVALETRPIAERAAQRVRESVLRVTAVERSEVSRESPPPFTTATLQEEASRELGFSVQQTMRIAQRLYDGLVLGGESTGLVTYFRTERAALSEFGVARARAFARGRFGQRYLLPEDLLSSRTSHPGPQDASEAIRPTDFGRLPNAVADWIGPEEAQLYQLIWKRALASQLRPARFSETRIQLASESQDVVLTAVGSEMLFEGYLQLAREDHHGASDLDNGNHVGLPEIRTEELAKVLGASPMQRFSEPPIRYTESSLVQALDELGISRPGTSAAIVHELSAGEWILRRNRQLAPTVRGRIVTAFLETFLGSYVQNVFATSVERDLDRIASGAADWATIMRTFWEPFREAVENVAALGRDDIRVALERSLERFLFGGPDSGSQRSCPSCADGRLVLALREQGLSVGCSNFPVCTFSRPPAVATDGEEGR